MNKRRAVNNGDRWPWKRFVLDSQANLVRQNRRAKFFAIGKDWPGPKQSKRETGCRDNPTPTAQLSGSVSPYTSRRGSYEKV